MEKWKTRKRNFKKKIVRKKVIIFDYMYETFEIPQGREEESFT